MGSFSEYQVNTSTCKLVFETTLEQSEYHNAAKSQGDQVVRPHFLANNKHESMEPNCGSGDCKPYRKLQKSSSSPCFNGTVQQTGHFMKASTEPVQSGIEKKLDFLRNLIGEKIKKYEDDFTWKYNRKKILADMLKLEMQVLTELFDKIKTKTVQLGQLEVDQVEIFIHKHAPNAARLMSNPRVDSADWQWQTLQKGKTQKEITIRTLRNQNRVLSSENLVLSKMLAESVEKTKHRPTSTICKFAPFRPIFLLYLCGKKCFELSKELILPNCLPRTSMSWPNYPFWGKKCCCFQTILNWPISIWLKTWFQTPSWIKLVKFFCSAFATGFVLGIILYYYYALEPNSEFLSMFTLPPLELEGQSQKVPVVPAVVVTDLVEFYDHDTNIVYSTYKWIMQSMYEISDQFKETFANMWNYCYAIANVDVDCPWK